MAVSVGKSKSEYGAPITEATQRVLQSQSNPTVIHNVGLESSRLAIIQLSISTAMAVSVSKSKRKEGAPITQASLLAKLGPYRIIDRPAIGHPKNLLREKRESKARVRALLRRMGMEDAEDALTQPDEED